MHRCREHVWFHHLPCARLFLGFLHLLMSFYQRSLPPRKKRRIDLDSAAIRGIWSLPVRRSEGRNESSDSVLVTSDGARTKVYFSNPKPTGSC